MSGTLLDYWTTGHYAGGASNHIPAGEDWKHVVGPIFVYFNSLADPKDPSQAELDKLTATSGSGMPAVPAVWHDNALALWNDAVDKSKAVKAAWPYGWVEGVDYPHKDGRATVTGQLVLDDPQAANKTLPTSHRRPRPPRLHQGLGRLPAARRQRQHRHLAARRQLLPVLDRRRRGRQLHHPQRPPRHLHAARLRRRRPRRVRQGRHHRRSRQERSNLGKLDWQPVRYGKQIWEIGYPDRTGDKFFKGDGANYWLWGWGLRYGDLFPNDITYTIGKSDYRKDWFFEEVPHSTTAAWMNPAAKDPYNQRFGWVNIPTGTAGPVARVGPRPGHHLDRQVHHAQSLARARPSCASRWPGPTAAMAPRPALPAA